MSDPKAHVALFVDFSSLSAASIEGAPAAGAVAAALLRYAGGVGRVTLARGYADWTERTDDVRAVQAARIVPVLVPGAPGGGDRAHVHLVVDAIECLFAGGEPDAYVIAAGDGRLLPLVHALRADGCDVLFVAPQGAAIDDVCAEADLTATVEEALAGTVGPASTPRASDEEDGEDDDEEASDAPPASASREPAPPPARAPSGDDRGAYRPRGEGRGFEGRGPEGRGFDGRGSEGQRGGPRGDARGGPRGFGDAPRGDRRDRAFGPPSRFGERGLMRGPPRGIDFANYDWAAFIKLIDELEHRLPFVGVRYLVNKVLGPRNCGVDDPGVKRDLINRAVDDGVLEMYEVGNVGERRDPVTACRLDRKSAQVIAVIGADTATPVVPEARDEGGDDLGTDAGEGDEGGLVEGGLPLDAAEADLTDAREESED